jgi:uncharacterized protein (TIGR02246 family)
MLVQLLLAAATSAAPMPVCAALEAAARPTIAEANGDWVRAMKAGDAAALARGYAEDGVFVQGDGSVTRGRTAIQALYAARAKGAAAIVRGELHSRGMACSGTGLVYEWGDGALAIKGPDGQVTTRGGPYLTVWKRIDGAWKIIRNLAF